MQHQITAKLGLGLALLALTTLAPAAAPPAERTLISSGSKWEALAGYSRAVVQGDWIFVSGTVGASGFSHMTGLPAAMHASTNSAWVSPMAFAKEH